MRRPNTGRTVGALLLVLVTESARAEIIQVKIEKLAFVPSQVTAHVGDTIEWVNADFVAHSDGTRRRLGRHNRTVGNRERCFTRT
jgi:plastocyanin